MSVAHRLEIFAGGIQLHLQLELCREPLASRTELWVLTNTKISLGLLAAAVAH